ncbi:Unannotated [Lentimonas sp. CC4]|nr:Unannotated [Lentimonas sp. CC4]CAA7075986.1 Unannotated [Lentimonas sp. CC4]CAA7168584.1 Unannotated [Lentimonas sp. CC21]CAA7180976.1 Unannotated [Lentimonas sp. CC8]
MALAFSHPHTTLNPNPRLDPKKIKSMSKITIKALPLPTFHSSLSTS